MEFQRRFSRGQIRCFHGYFPHVENDYDITKSSCNHLQIRTYMFDFQQQLIDKYKKNNKHINKRKGKNQVKTNQRYGQGGNIGNLIYR